MTHSAAATTGAPDRESDSMLRAGHSAHLLRRPAGGRQRHGPVGDGHRSGATSTAGTTLRRRLQQALARPVVQLTAGVCAPSRITTRGVQGAFEASATAPERLSLTWTHGNDLARLDVSLRRWTASIHEFRDQQQQRRGMAHPAGGPGMTSDPGPRSEPGVIVKTLTYHVRDVRDDDGFSGH